MKTEKTGIARTLSVIAGFLMVGFGIYLLFNPRGIVWIFSIAAVIRGVSQIVQYIGEKEARNGWDIIAGAVNVLFGSIMLFGSTGTRVMSVLTIEMFIAFWALFVGIAQIFGSFKLKKLGLKKWGGVLAGGIGLTLCGIVCFGWPLLSAALFAGFIGIFTSVSLIIMGLTGLANAMSDDTEA